MKKLIILTSLMFSSVILSNACISDFNNQYNQAEGQYNMALSFCNYNFIYVPSADDFCRQSAYMEYNASVNQAVAALDDCFN